MLRCRRLAQDLTHPLITTLQQECTRSTCPEMKAGEWLYLCVAHGNDGSMEQCCAIDYILHTLDSATALLSSPRAFPSRIQIPGTSHRHFSSLARRLGRIFAHAYFHHREAFEQAEVESSLYARFLALSSKFELVPSEFLPIPPEAFAGHHEEDEEVGPRGLDAAGLEPQSNSSIAQQPQHQEPGPYSRDSLTLQVPGEPFQTGAPSPPGLQAENSPRKMGRNRTDTMVPSDVTAIMEELAARSPSVGAADKEKEHEEVEEEEEVIPKEEETIPQADEKAESETEEPSTESEEESDSDEAETEEPAVVAGKYQLSFRPIKDAEALLQRKRKMNRRKKRPKTSQHPLSQRRTKNPHLNPLLPKRRPKHPQPTSNPRVSQRRLRRKTKIRLRVPRMRKRSPKRCSESPLLLLLRPRRRLQKRRRLMRRRRARSLLLRGSEARASVVLV